MHNWWRVTLYVPFETYGEWWPTTQHPRVVEICAPDSRLTGYAHRLSFVAGTQQGCARNLLSRDRDETLQLPRRWPRPWSSRDSRESRELQCLAETFSMTYGETHRQWKKLYGLINSHHRKRFLFVILWVFAIYFDNYRWIINSLHHKELQLQCCRHEPLCLLQFASNWN